MSLKDKATSLNSTGIKFMDGRTKGEELPTGSPVTVDGYGFIDDGDEKAPHKYVVLSLKECPDEFFFGGSVISDKFEKLNDEMDDDDKAEIETAGLPVLFEKHKNKAGKREYMTCTFYPEVDGDMPL